MSSAKNPHLAKNAHYSKSASLLLVALAYVLAGVVVWATWPFYGHLGPIWGVLIADLIATAVIWACGLPFRNASVYDPYWSVVPLAIAGYWWSLSGFDTGDYSRLLLMLVLVYWSLRLTGNWIVGWPGLSHEDWRYQDLRAKSGKAYQLVNLFGICGFPTVLVFLGMLPAYPVLALEGAANPFVDIAALVVGLGAVTIQWVADEQMRIFRGAPDGNTAFMTGGLWAWSRHPNYFGEVMMWTSLWLFALAGFGAAFAWTGVGALAMLLLFLFISIPMMDKRSAAKRPGYADYMKRSSAFWMLPPRR